MIIKREIQKKCVEFLKQYPVITITGPRQSGKTTLAKMLFSNKPYINFEEPNVRNRFLDDPEGFLSDLPEGGILDEIQRVPEVTSYIQPIVDSAGKNGMFILTGSMQFEIRVSSVNPSQEEQLLLNFFL